MSFLLVFLPHLWVGSREAFNLFQLLCLPYSIQVGLLPQNKLLDLLATAIAGDTINTIRHTRELLATGVEPQALLSQLASLITDMLSHAAAAQDSSPPASSSEGTTPLRTGSELSKKTSNHKLSKNFTTTQLMLCKNFCSKFLS